MYFSQAMKKDWTCMATASLVSQLIPNYIL